MGRWGKLTKRQFRWSELRFETIYTTPRFGLSPYTGKPTYREHGRRLGSMVETTPYYPLDGSSEMIEKTYSRQLEDIYQDLFDGPDEIASWVKLVEALHQTTAQILACSGPVNKEVADKVQNVPAARVNRVSNRYKNYYIPIVTPQRRSWDFVPPEVIRPLAVTTVSDIAIMIRRLGMVWKDFKPSEGLLRAEGNETTISSITVRSVGTVLEMSMHNLKYWNSINELFVPSKNADMMGFGILPGEDALGVCGHNIGTEDELLSTLHNIDRKTAETVKSIMTTHHGWTPGISDVIGMAAPMIRLPGSCIIRVPQPAGYAVGLTYQEEGFVVFYHRLKDLITERDSKAERVSAQMRFTLLQYEELRDRYGPLWEDQHQCRINRTPVEFLDDLHARHTATTHYFTQLQNEYAFGKGGQTFRYTDLLYSHIRNAVNHFSDASTSKNAQIPSQAHNNYGMRRIAE
ncbi:MAG: hypothetical protein Q9164_005207, partial [Protoblastenia rupestris]